MEGFETIVAGQMLGRGDLYVAGNRYSLTVWLEVTAILGDVGALR